MMTMKAKREYAPDTHSIPNCVVLVVYGVFFLLSLVTTEIL